MTDGFLFALFLLLPGIIAALVRRRSNGSDRLLAGLTASGAAVVLLQLAESIAQGPMFEINASRIANAVALVKGFNILPGANEGPLIDFMYGPMFVLAYTPAALGTSPGAAIRIGIVLSFLFVILPFACILFAGLRGRSRTAIFAAIACFGILCLYDSGLRWVTWYVFADPPALALAACACACVFTTRKPGTLDAQPSYEAPGDYRLFAGALLSVLAVWSKQTSLPILVALPLYLWLVHGFRTAFRMAIFVAVSAVAVASVFVAWFGVEGLVFNMVQVPGGHPWKYTIHGGSSLRDAAVSFGKLLVTASVAGFLTAAVTAMNWRRGATLRAWMASQPWSVLAWVALFMVPTATMSGAKIGGEHNVYALSTYFLTAAALYGLAETASSDRQPRLAARWLLAAILAFGIADQILSADRHAQFHAAMPQLRDLRNNPPDQATAFALAHPGEVHCIDSPLIGLYSDGVLYSNMYGRYDRALAGYQPAPELMLSYAPPKLRYVVVRRDFPWFAKPSVYPEYHDFTELVPVKELPHHFVWQRPATSTSIPAGAASGG
jgi:hypothetical protein